MGETIQMSFGSAVREQNLKVAGYPRFEPQHTDDGDDAAAQFRSVPYLKCTLRSLWATCPAPSWKCPPPEVTDAGSTKHRHPAQAAHPLSRRDGSCGTNTGG